MRIGEIQTLRVARVSEYGLYLADEEGNVILNKSKSNKHVLVMKMPHTK